VELPKSPIQRVQYYDRQFLTVPDFQDEQSYHRVMRRLLNGSLFCRDPGIEPGVLLGLDVQFDDSNPPRNLILKPGVAVDGQGQLLVWTDEDSKKLVLDKTLSLEKENQSGIKVVTISYRETDTNKTPGLTPFNRTSEAPKVELSAEPNGIVLAKVNLDNKPPQVDTSALSGRTMAVLQSGGLNVSVPLHLERENSASGKEDVTALVTTENSGNQALRVIYGFNKDNVPTAFQAALAVISQRLNAHGLYVQGAPKRMEAVRVDGNALILGSATLPSVNTGVVTSVCYNVGSEALNAGDLVMLGEGDIRAVGPRPANSSDTDQVFRAFPVEKAVFIEDPECARIVGFVYSKIPDTIQTIQQGASADNSDPSIKPNEFLFVVTRGFFETAKVTAPPKMGLKLGQLLIGPRTKEDAPGRATALDGETTLDGKPTPKPGTVVGKAFQTLEAGAQDDKFKVFVNLM
jgi:hypothetical protein